MVRWRGALIIVGAWLIVALFTTQLQSFAVARSLTAARWFMLLAPNLVSTMAWAAFTPLILRLAARLPIERPGLARAVALHLLTGAGMTLADAILVTRLGALSGWYTTPALRVVFAATLFPYLTCYATLVLIASVRHYAELSRARALHAARLEAQLAAARLLALEGQLRPHFLFNTLNMIAEQMRLDIDRADRMLTNLSSLLRASIGGSECAEVPLRRELELAECYLDISRARFGRRLRVRSRIDPRTLDAAVPALLLQPLIENAIRHGVEPCGGGGVISIATRATRDLVVIEIQDNGAGLPPDGYPDGVGLRVTRERMRQLYGARARFGVLPARGGGTRVVLVVPRTSGARAAA